MARQHTSGQHVTWSGSLGGSGPLTLAHWVRRATGEGGWTFNGEPSTAGSERYAGIYVDPTAGFARAQCDHQIGLPSAAIAQSGFLITTNAWHHVCAVFASPTSRTIYVDGVAAATNAQDESVAWPGFGIVEVCRLNTNGANATGRVAEAAIWTVALSAAEIDALWRGVPPGRVRPAALFLYWPLWGVAATEPDLSGNGRNGTVTGATAADHAPVGR
jgi:hypothetical protein